MKKKKLLLSEMDGVRKIGSETGFVTYWTRIRFFLPKIQFLIRKM